eukprot:TRINITY_DN17733_c1_g1_i1.p1 TRINITY_DN17733_c1_g1~~TRINITY_DN17733_c1_g1_i1.p1  ORF type:complete len:115 (+),score=12.46 TRINITY_DN17733_c1_g1_i1:176-520(+)
MSTTENPEVPEEEQPQQLQQGSSNAKKKKEIYTYELPWVGNAMSWSVRCDKRFRLAVASYVEEYQNRVNIIQLDDEQNKLVSRGAYVPFSYSLMNGCCLVHVWIVEPTSQIKQL